MRFLSTCFPILLFLHSLLSSAQVSPTPASGGYGAVAIAYGDEWSMAGNPAGLTTLSTISFAAGAHNPFLLSELSRSIVAVNIPGRKISCGMLVESSGFELFQNNTFAAAIAQSFGNKLSIGWKQGYRSIQIPDESKINRLTGSIGFQYKLGEKFVLGYTGDYEIPLRATTGEVTFIQFAGINMNVSEKLSLLGNVAAPHNAAFEAQAGLEYRPFKQLSLRSGINSTAGQMHMGFRVVLQEFKIDLAFSRHPALGWSPLAGICWSPKSKDDVE